MKLEFSRQIFENVSNIKFNQNPSSEAELFHAEGRTDGHEVNSRFSQICKRA